MYDFRLGGVGQCRPPITELGTGAEVSADTGNNDDGLGKGGRGLTQWNDIGEIKFMTDSGESNVNSGASEKLWCKIKCVDGEWVGPLCSANGGILFLHLTKLIKFTKCWQLNLLNND